MELHQPDSQPRPSRDDELRARRYPAFPDNADGTHSVIGNLPDADAWTVERALAAITGKPGLGDQRTYGQRLADALFQLCDAYTRGQVKGGRSNLATVLVVIGVDDLNGPPAGPGTTHVVTSSPLTQSADWSGTRTSPTTSPCDHPTPTATHPNQHPNPTNTTPPTHDAAA